jgi:uncharacterized protein involved in exopolysaccharide biosynthesis
MEGLQTSNTSLRNVLHFVFKRKALVLWIFFITFAIVAIGTFVIKPTYEASAKILVKIGRENIYLPTMPTSGNQQTAVISNNREEQINSEIEIITSQGLLDLVVETLGPAVIYDNLEQKRKGLFGIIGSNSADETETKSTFQKAVLKLKRNLSVVGVKNSNVIQIRFRHQDPQMAADVTNKLVALFLDRHLEVYRTPQSYKFFNEQSRILKDKLSQEEKGLALFKRQQNVSELDHERELLLTNEADLRTGLNKTLSEIAETQSRIGQLKKQLRIIPKTVPQEEEFEASHYVINTLQGRLVELQLEEQKLLTKYTPGNRLVVNIREEIDIVRKKIAEHEGKKYEKSRSGLNTTYQRIQEELLSNQAELNALQAKKASQIQQLDGYRGRLDELNGNESTLVDLKRQVEVDQQNYNLYLTKFEESRISQAMDSEKIANLTPIQMATPPSKPIKPKRLLNLILGFFLGIFGSLLLAFLAEYLDDTLEMPEDAESSLSLPVLASIPELSP